MEPYIAKRFPIEYKLDKELLRLLSEANLKYGELLINVVTILEK